jgi:DNA-binding response OmpR family regulator
MSKRILMIEPSPTLRAIFAMYFQRNGHQLVLFEDYEDAAQALASFSGPPPDLAFVALDVHRPQSVRVTELVREHYAQIPLIVLIAQEQSSQSTVQQLVQATHALVLPKPFSIRDVLDLLAECGQVTSLVPSRARAESDGHA